MFEFRPLGNAVAKQFGGGTPSRQVASYWNGPIPWASVKDFADDRDRILGTQESISEAGLYASASNLVPAGTPLVCTRMAVGRSAIAPMPVAINQDVKALAPAREINSAYLLRLLQYAQPRAEAAAVGSTVKGIRIQDYLSIPVPMAPAGDQPRIAEILHTLDTVIRQTEAIIEKLKQVKQGLLHDLLTRGIDANGELRPPQSASPHLYKSSALGWIPREWKVGCAADWCERLTVGVVNSATHAYVPHGVPFIRSQNVKPNRIDMDDVLHVTKSFNAQQGKSMLREGDVVIVRTGYPGTAAVVPPQLDGANCFSLILATPTVGRLSPFFLAHYMNSPTGKAQVGRLQFGSAQHNFNVGEMRLLPMPLPSLHEQEAIVEGITEFESNSEAANSELRKLRLLKEGLMDDLLRGRVRVTPLLD